jgi:hypothetical protein
MRRILTAILSSIAVASVLCFYLVLKRVLFQGSVDAIEAGMLFACAIAAFCVLSFKEWAQSRSTRLERELDDLSSVDDELVNLVRKNDAFRFIRCNVAPAHAALDYPWVIQSKTFDFNAAIAKVKLRPGRPLDANNLRKQLKADLKRTCGGWFLKPLVLGVVLEASASNGWSADLFIDHNYAGGIGIAWLIMLHEDAMTLSSAHYPRSLQTTIFYEEFLSHLLAKGYALTNRSAGAAVERGIRIEGCQPPPG